jgi:4-deoxy-L-threo-5-hexosulose-uronate ketol-isomerase
MDTRYGANPADARGYDTQRLRAEFRISGLFAPDELKLVYSHSDRMIAGSAMPVRSPVELKAQDELRAAHFLERREAGVINIGGPGTVAADGKRHALANGDGIYLGRGTKDVSFESDSSSAPAQFYVNSCPAHAAYPTVRVPKSAALETKLGTQAECNVRTIRKYFHPDGAKSCQLVMGLTVLEPGSVWNTMPCHTHERRMEVYLYFDIAEGGFVFHYMGRPGETRHILLRDREAVISPSWSIHSGCGTKNYSFIWGMAGENQAFGDMDPVGAGDIA